MAGGGALTVALASGREPRRSRDQRQSSQQSPALGVQRAPSQILSIPRSPIDEKAFAKVLVDRILRDVDEAAGIKPNDVPLPPGEKYSYYLRHCGRTVTPAAFKIFRTVERPSANISATCRLVCPDSYASTTAARSWVVIRRRCRGGETNGDGLSVTSTSSCTPLNNMFGLN